MDPFTGYLLILAIGWALRGAVNRARADYKRTREQEVQAAEKKAGKAGKQITPSARNKILRRHRTGWWASEVRHGFPVTRTGVHTGWLAHQAAAVHTKAQREQARTTHLDAVASFASLVKDHRRQQAQIRDEIEEALAKSGVEQDGTRKAVKEAAGAVIYPFPERKVPTVPQASGPFASYDPVPMGGAWSESWRAGDRRMPEPGPHAKPRLSSNLRPGDPLCEACGGTGGNPEGTDACPVCRGWGRADPDPATFAAARDGAICTACGRPGTAGDPVLADTAGHPTHRSHLAECHERYQRGLTGDCCLCGEPLRLRHHDGKAHLDCDRADRKHFEIDDAVIEADHMPVNGNSPGDRGHAGTDEAVIRASQCTLCGEPLSGEHDGWNHKACGDVTAADDEATEVHDSRDLETVERDLASQGKCSWQIRAPGWDGGGIYCGREVIDDEDPPAPGEPDHRKITFCPEHQCEADGDDEGAAQERNDRVKDLLLRDQAVSAHSTSTEGEAPMSDTTFNGVKQASTAAIGAADQDTATIRGRKDAAYALADEMQSLNVDPVVIDAQMSYADSLAQAESHLVAAGEFATAVGSNLERYHGGVQEAVDAAPGKTAERSFHEGS